MTSLSDRLKALREESGLSQAKVAKALNISYSGYQNYEYGKREKIPGDVLSRMAMLFNTTTDYILGVSNTRYKTIKPDVSESNFVDRPLYGSIAAGTPLEMLPIDETYETPRPVAEKYPNGFWLRIASDSMNLLFPVGTLVYVNPMEDIRVNGKPYALCVNGYDATVKMVDKMSNGYRLTPASTNPVYVPQEYDYSIPGTDRITVIGEIVYDMKPFDWSY